MAITMRRRKPDSGLGNMRASPAAPGRNIDWVLLAAQAALTVIGCCIVYSATRTRTTDPFRYVTRQVIFAIPAALALVGVMSFDYDWFRHRSWQIYAASLGLLAALLVHARATDSTQISFDLPFINVQPAEISKVAVLVALCAYLAEERTDEVSYPRFLGGLIVVGVASALVVVQPDLGSASVLAAMAMGVLLVAGAKVRYIMAYTLLSLATVGAAFIGRLVNDYQLERVRVLFDENNPELRGASYQVKLALQALGTGGIFGKGWLQGPLTNDAQIPVLWADFPFAALGEQFGAIGCAVALGMFVIVLLRIWRIAHLSKDMFGTYICAGVFAMLVWQIVQNVGMTMKLLPVTGLPLPFISYGGSGLIVWFVMLGLVQSVHMRRMR
ncbi:rod shape-determining protein RodA [soil metagenome]